MKLLTEYKFYGYLYGFVAGFFGCLVVLTSISSSDEVPITEILMNSFWTGVIVGFVGWLYLALSTSGMVSGSFDADSSGNSYYSDDSGGSDGGGGGD